MKQSNQTVFVLSVGSQICDTLVLDGDIEEVDVRCTFKLDITSSCKLITSTISVSQIFVKSLHCDSIQI